MTEKSNTAIWDAVCVTDPDMTKKVTQRGGFTAIDAYYTVQRLTERFGPLGTGWGWAADFRFEEGAVVCLAHFWYELDGKRSEPTPILTMNKLAQGNGIDEDAGKKALTDAITKWASYLGFSADVFLGKFDDNRYVQGLLKQKQEGGESPPPNAPISPFPNAAQRKEFCKNVATAYESAPTLAALKLARAQYAEKFKQMRASGNEYDGIAVDEANNQYERAKLLFEKPYLGDSAPESTERQGIQY